MVERDPASARINPCIQNEYLHRFAAASDIRAFTKIKFTHQCLQ